MLVLICRPVHAHDHELECIGIMLDDSSFVCVCIPGTRTSKVCASDKTAWPRSNLITIARDTQTSSIMDSLQPALFDSTRCTTSHLGPGAPAQDVQNSGARCQGVCPARCIGQQLHYRHTTVLPHCMRRKLRHACHTLAALTLPWAVPPVASRRTEKEMDTLTCTGPSDRD